MKSPKSYIIRKFNLRQFINSDGVLNISEKDEKKYEIKQGDNPLFRQIRIITGRYNSSRCKEVIFLNCKGWNYKTKQEVEDKVAIGEREEKLRKLLSSGIYVNGKKYVISEKSASMSRNAIIGFVAEEVSKELDERITMDMPIKQTVIAKYLAYRGLFFSGCFCLENILPKIVIVPDVSKTIPGQRIKHMVDVEKECVNKKGEKYIWKEKGIQEDILDVDINLWDGSGIISNEFCELINKEIGIENANSFIIRMPYFKGMVHNVDFKKWFKNNNVSEIKDIWGKTHNIDEVDMVVTESFYKGKKYFKKYNDYRDWEYYLDKFREYNHCFGVTAWNYTFEDEPIYTRTSYQILQDLDLPYEEFSKLSEYSKDWIDKVINGDDVYTNCFLGLLKDNHKASNYYMKALLKDQRMLKEESVRKYILNLITKKIDEMKCGKLYVEGAFKFIVIDLIMFLRYISGQEVFGELKDGEFYAVDKNGVIKGNRVVERNPHITDSEHCVLDGKETDLLTEYCGHLANVFQCNGYGITLPRLNGCDEDGDRVFVIKNKTMQDGIHTDKAIVLDMEDKITAKEKEINLENIIDCVVDSMVSLVGEFSNYASCYHNKFAKTDSQKQKYLDYIAILSIATGKSIDYAKTGVLFMPPHIIQKFAKPFPYFMKYASDYYRGLSSFSKARSNMNLLAFEIEKLHKTYRFKKSFEDFDFTIMISGDEIKDEELKLCSLKDIYKEYNLKTQKLKKEEIKNKDGLYIINWDLHYSEFRKKCLKIESNKKLLADLLVKLCYTIIPKRDKKFMWLMAGDDIVNNIKQQTIILPYKDDGGEYEYLGRRYKLGEVDVVDV